MKIKNFIKMAMLGVLTTCLAIFSFGCEDLSYFKSKALNLTDEYSYGIKLNSLEEIRNEKVTKRAPLMEVLERNLPRTEPEVLSDTFYLPNFSTGELTNAHITFNGYPTPATPKAPVTPKDETKITDANRLASFENYMLLRQNMWYNSNALKFAEEGKIKKHPAADLLYGTIPVEDNAVKKRIVVDPDFVGYGDCGLTTGLYLPAGEYVKVKVSGLKAGESIKLSTHMQSSFGWAMDFAGTDRLVTEAFESDSPDLAGLSKRINLHGHYNRDDAWHAFPYIQASFTFTENREYTIASIYGGMLNINNSRNTSAVELVVTGAVETPHFILGVTTVDYFEEYLRNAPGLIGAVDTEIGQLIGPSIYIRQTDDIEKVAYLWHSIFSLNVSLMGRSYKYGVVLKFDIFVPSGAAVALSGNDAAHPAGWMAQCLKYNNFITTGSWGVLHELGHTQHMAHGKAWGMGGSQEGEVMNNVLGVLGYTMFCNIDVYHYTVEHEDAIHPYYALNNLIKVMNKQEYTDYNNLGYFEAVSFYSILINTFSPQKLVEVIYTYKTNPVFCANSRADFIYRCAITYGLDFRWYANVMVHANITNDMFTEEQIKFMNGLKEFVPIACFYSNGTNDVETLSKYKVNARKATTFDLKTNINCPREYEIIKIEKPKYGKIKVDKDGTTVTYTPPEKMLADDEFGVIVKIKDSVNVKLPIRLSFDYNSAYFAKYENVNSTTLDDAKNEISKLSPNSIDYTASAGKNTYSFESGRQFDNFKFAFLASQAGEYKFSLASVGQGELEAGTSKKNLNLKLSATTSGYNDEKSITLNLNKGDLVYFNANLLTNVKSGGLLVGVKKPGQTGYNTIPSTDLYSFNYTTSDIENINKFGFKPKFIRSIKTTSNYSLLDKSEWKILKAPNAQAGDSNKLENMIDGDYNTIFHTTYSGGEITPMPHEIVIDFGKVSMINWIQIATRSNGNSLIKEYELYTSTDEINYSLVSSGDEMPYKNQRADLNFNCIQVRYIKLIIKSTSGVRFSVISELSAGLKSSSEQMVKPSGKYTFQKGFEEYNASGAIKANKKNSKVYFEFKGTEFSLYANKGVGYGDAKVTVDGEDYGTFSLDSSVSSINSLVYALNGLKNSKHVVEITTLSDKEVNIGFMSIPFENTLIGATNIPANNGLIISLIVFVLLFALVLAFVIVYFTVVGFRNFINKLFKIDNKKEKFVKPVESHELETKKATKEKSKKNVSTKQTKTPAKKEEKKVTNKNKK